MELPQLETLPQVIRVALVVYRTPRFPIAILPRQGIVLLNREEVPPCVRPSQYRELGQVLQPLGADGVATRQSLTGLLQWCPSTVVIHRRIANAW